MGRCNNRRTRERAQALQNTPARARFSNNNNNSGGRGGNNNKKKRGGPAASQQQQQTKKNVVHRIANRVSGGGDANGSGGGSGSGGTTRQLSSSTSSGDRNPFKNNPDLISRLDEITLSDESIRLAYRLLRDLNVVVDDDEEDRRGNGRTRRRKGQLHSSSSSGGHDDDDDDGGGAADAAAVVVESSTSRTSTNDDYAVAQQQEEQQQQRLLSHYSEYDDDVREEGDSYYYTDRVGLQPPQPMPPLPPTTIAAAAAARSNDDGDQDDAVDDDDDDIDEYCRDTEWEGDEYRYLPETTTLGDNPTAATTNDDFGDDGEMPDDDDDDNEISNDDDEGERRRLILQNDPTYRYLTAQLSFSDADASRACLALDTWQGAKVNNNSSNSNDQASSTSSAAAASQRLRVGLALDWLALHLSEPGLKKGLAPRKAAAQGPGPGGHQLAPRPVIRTIPIPHPSISVATKLTDDEDFKRKALLEERAVGFVQLGFSYADTMRVLEEQQQQNSPNIVFNDRPDEESSEADTLTTKRALREGETLQLLLEALEEEALRQLPESSANGGATAEIHDVDEDLIREEREQEKEVLRAVYDERFEECPLSQHEFPEPSSKRAMTWDRYKISVAISSKNEDDDVLNVDKEGELHVFLRPGYPISRTPLFLFCYPHFAPPLLRRINQEIVLHNHDMVGMPCIFEAVTFLNESILSIQDSFQKEVRAQEFESQQRKMRKEAGHDIDDDFEEMEGKNLGRRRRAKLKGLERAYDQDERAQETERERLQRQEARLKRIKAEDGAIRQTMAERAIEKREKDMHEEGMRKAYRSTMLVSLNRGETSEEARRLADQAKMDYCLKHGLEVPGSGHGESSSEQLPNPLDGKKDANDSIFIPRATPTTMAFMDRLRSMYNTAAAKQAGQFHLQEASEKTITESETDAVQPRPVAVPVGELSEIMTEVDTVQKEQPWLISTDARVPAISDEKKGDGLGLATSREQNEEQARISQRLKQELDQRIDLSKTSKSLKKISKQRQRLPAYQMGEEIVRTIANNRVTVVAGDTGCGKTSEYCI